MTTKEKLQYSVAIIGLSIGVIFCGISLFTPPPGQIDNSAIYVLGLFLSFCGAIFGIDLSYQSKIDKMRIEIENRLGAMAEKPNKEEE